MCLWVGGTNQGELWSELQIKCATFRHLQENFLQYSYLEFIRIHFVQPIQYPSRPKVIQISVPIYLVGRAVVRNMKSCMPKLTHCLLSLAFCLLPIQLVCPEGTTPGDTQGNGNAHFCVIWNAAIMALSNLVPQLYVMSALNSFVAVHLRINLLNL